MRRESLPARRVALYGVMVALGMIIGYIEHLIPLPFAAPGVKLGLANLVTLTALYLLGTRAALIISVLRVVLNGLMFTGVNAMLYALAGALLAWGGMAAIYRLSMFSGIGVSMLGGICHNIGQYALAAFIVRTAGLLRYLPVLLISGVATGTLVGALAMLLVRRVGPVLSVKM